MLSPVSFPIPLPDDPRKWDGWSRYSSPDPYERLCLDPHSNPSNELIEERFRELLLWWQKKLPLKNQPSNPIAHAAWHADRLTVQEWTGRGEPLPCLRQGPAAQGVRLPAGAQVA